MEENDGLFIQFLYHHITLEIASIIISQKLILIDFSWHLFPLKYFFRIDSFKKLLSTTPESKIFGLRLDAPHVTPPISANDDLYARRRTPWHNFGFK